jgi:hypothetical protein
METLSPAQSVFNNPLIMAEIYLNLMVPDGRATLTNCLILSRAGFHTACWVQASDMPKKQLARIWDQGCSLVSRVGWLTKG